MRNVSHVGSVRPGTQDPLNFSHSDLPNVGPLLSVTGLSVDYRATTGAPVHALANVDFRDWQR